MKKTVLLVLCLLSVSIICSACWTCGRHYRYHPPESETTYEQLLSTSKALGDTWSFVDNWGIIMGEKSADVITSPEDTYIQVLDELEEVLRSKPLDGLVQPEGVRNYHRYAENLVEDIESENIFWANLGTGVNTAIADDQEYLHNLRIVMPNFTKCYVIVDYGTNLEVIKKRYVYYTEDAQVIGKMKEWAEKYINAYGIMGQS